MTCLVSGRPSPVVTWYKGGASVSQDHRHKIIVNEQEGCHSLLITSAQLGDQGSLGCIASNRSGEASTMVI